MQINCIGFIYAIMRILGMETRVLCTRCAENYRESGYVLYRQNDIKRECYICNRQGYEYKLRDRSSKNGKFKH